MRENHHIWWLPRYFSANGGGFLKREGDDELFGGSEVKNLKYDRHCF